MIIHNCQPHKVVKHTQTIREMLAEGWNISIKKNDRVHLKHIEYVLTPGGFSLSSFSANLKRICATNHFQNIFRLKEISRISKFNKNSEMAKSVCKSLNLPIKNSSALI